jgi:DNA-binding NtrC family response regulator
MSLENRCFALIEDDPIMGESLAQRLQLEGAKVQWWRTGADALIGLSGSAPDAIICDIRLPDRSGEDVFRSITRDRRTPPFLFITGYGDIEQAVKLMKEGARDYLTKPFIMGDFLTRLEQILGPIESEGDPVLGVSAAIREVELFLHRAARVTSNLLLTGETGVGKEVCARLLHSLREKPTGPFMAVNCAAIPAELLESELFGHEKGAFTGAQARHLGYCERAGKGVLFLDEVAELLPKLQAKLLRLIEDRSFHRVGGEQPIPFKARLICATNADISANVREGKFREDLYYRVNVLSLRVPPLRERVDDIEWLIDKFFVEFAERMEGNAVAVSALGFEAARQHPWPGNVRELKNRIERSVALASSRWIMPGDLFPEREPTPLPLEEVIAPLFAARGAAEKRHIERALEVTGGAILPAAKLLGISRTTLWEKMKRYGLAIVDH